MALIHLDTDLGGDIDEPCAAARQSAAGSCGSPPGRTPVAASPRHPGRPFWLTGILAHTIIQIMEPPESQVQPNRSRNLAGRSETLSLAALLLVGIAIYLAGVFHDLPYVVNIDETTFFGLPAARIAATGDLHPGWFGHPASAIIYPLSGIYQLWQAAAHQGDWLRPNPQILTSFEQVTEQYLLLGRLLSVCYGVGALAFLWLLGRRTLGAPTALLAVALFIPMARYINYVQMVRDDSATVFYAVLTLWTIVRLWSRLSLGRQVAAGLACGLAISTKYYLGILCLLLLAVDSLLMRRAWFDTTGWRRVALWSMAGVAAAVLGFGLTTPYFVLDFAAAWRDLTGELRPTHLGADGLSPIQNLWWYVSTALPTVLGWGRYLLALTGVAWLGWKGPTAARLLLAFSLLFLLGISFSPLHWERWVFPILPVLVLAAATSLLGLTHWLGEKRGFRPRAIGIITGVLCLAACASPVYQTAVLEVKQTRPSTMVQVRQWLDANLSPGAVIAREEYTFPVDRFKYGIVGGFALAEQPLSAYIDQGATLVAISSSIYGRYYREPSRYAKEISFYEALEDGAVRVYEAKPDRWTGGPTVTVYRVGIVP